MLLWGTLWYRNRHKNPDKAKFHRKLAIIMTAIMVGIMVLNRLVYFV